MSNYKKSISQILEEFIRYALNRYLPVSMMIIDLYTAFNRLTLK